MRMPLAWPARLLGEGLDWDRDGRDWPLREASRFVSAGGVRWHVQELGAGPPLLLVHGTGAASHSWRGLAPLLAQRFSVIAPDLPGHGFSSAPGPRGLTLPGMARSLGALLERLGRSPTAAIGHSAGAAILCRMSLDGRCGAETLVSLNGSLRPLRGFARRFYSPVAKLLTWNPIVPRLAARRAADPAVVERLVKDTGSRLDAEGVRLYQKLARTPQHLAGALGMMASWNLDALDRDLPGLLPRLVLVVGDRDRFVSPEEGWRVRERVPRGEVVVLPGLGHLAHEEAPEQVAEILFRVLDSEEASK